MNFFKCEKPHVCEECGVHFEPRKDSYSRLCFPHAKPRIDRDARRSRVMGWANINWEKLEEQAVKELDAAQAQFHKRLADSMQRQQQAAQQANYYSGGLCPGSMS
jgi:hypothetical protein